MKKYEITLEALNTIEDVMRAGTDRYAIDEIAGNGFFVRAFKNHPKNTEPDIVAMKIALVDTTNSTNLGRLLGTKDFKDKSGKMVHKEVFTLSDLVDKIISIKNFDERVKNGDVSLVTELIKWGDQHGLNATSFFSKYCLYHNYISYEHDDYSIFDSVVRDNLGRYLTEAEAKAILPDLKLVRRQGKSESDILATAVASRIEKMRTDCDYTSYHKLIGDILKLKNIDSTKVKNPRRKLDYLVWYMNR